MGKLFQDPAWWMTAVVMALIVGVIANFATYGISKAIARFSPKFRKWRERRRAKFLREAQDLARDFPLIVFQYLYAIGLMVLSGMIQTIMVALTVTFGLTTKDQTLDQKTNSFGVTVFVAFCLMSGFFAIILFDAVRNFRLANKARFLYEKSLLERQVNPNHNDR